ncbi:MAG: PAS domain S-box protein [Sideroxydans sp.]|nr:PAS domain S-box protein [Sideroxydans sp.]
MPTQAHAEELNYRRMLESSPDCVIRYDLKGRISYMTPGLLGFLGINAAEVLGKLPSEAWPDGRFAAIEKAANQALQTGDQTHAEFPAADANGVTYLKQVDVVPERNETGQLIGTIAYGRSITALHEAESNLRQFVDNLPGMAYVFRLSPDGHGSFPFISAGIEEFYGLKPADVQHDMMPIHLLAHPDDRGHIEAAIAETARTLAPLHVESRICRPGLPIRWLEMHSMPERDTDGGTLWRGIMLDITVRKQLEADQQEHLRHFQSMDRVNRAMQGANNLEQMMHDVLDVVLSIFDCDRAFLAHPREPDDEESIAPIERTRPEYPGASTLGLAIPLDEEMAALLRITRDSTGPVQFGLGAEHHLPHCLSEQYAVKSLMIMLLHSKLGKPWRFGLHRCAYTRAWTAADERLFQKIGEHLQDGLTSLLINRNLIASEQQFRSLAENLPDVVVRYNRKAEVLFANHALKRYVGEVAEVAGGTTPREHHADGSFEDYAKVLDNVLTHGKAGEIEKTSVFPNGQHWTALVRMVPEHDERGEIIGALAIGRDITERKQMETELKTHLTHLENMDRINRAMQGTNNLNEMMRNVLDVVLSIFNCDRVYLITPCDPNATEWSVPMERTKPEYPGALTLGLTVPMMQDVAEVMRITLSSDSPVKFGPAAEYPLPASAAKQFSIQSKMNMALHPKLGTAWLFGIHQCSHARVWTPAEVRLLHEIGLRLQDGLTNLLMYQDMSASEEKFRSLAENMPDNVVRYDRQARTIYVNPKLERTLGYVAAKMIGTTIRELHPNGEYEDYANLLDTVLARGQSGEIEKVALTPDGETSVHLIRVIPERNESGEIIGAIAIGRDITQLKKEEEVLQLAYHDTLTDLPNRRLLLDRLNHTMSASKRSRRYVALMFVDLDNFKPLNDKYGHDVGDLLLIEVAHRIANCVRDADTVSRFGGDEFVVLLSDLDTESANAIAQARIVAEKIRASLARPYRLEIQQEGKPSITVEYHCTSSIGTVVAVNHEVSAEDLLKRADQAMYQAKETGRDRVCFYDGGH